MTSKNSSKAKVNSKETIHQQEKDKDNENITSDETTAKLGDPPKKKAIKQLSVQPKNKEQIGNVSDKIKKNNDGDLVSSFSMKRDQVSYVSVESRPQNADGDKSEQGDEENEKNKKTNAKVLVTKKK